MAPCATDLADALARGDMAGRVCVMGVFDGMHRGHAGIIRDAARDAADGVVALTFDKDPEEVLRPERLVKLMENDARLQALADDACVREVVAIPFDETFAALDAGGFMDRVFGGATPREVHVGRDFRFGAQAMGDADDLRRWGGSHGMKVVAHELLCADGAPVTATRIRRLLAQGRLEDANALLGRRWSVGGVVRRGRQDGRAFGIRTANLGVPRGLLALGDGVYGGYAHVDGARYKAAVSVGIPPTFEDVAKDDVEVHLLGFDGADDALYGRPLAVEFATRLRDMRKFASIDDLKRTVTADIERVRAEL